MSFSALSKQVQGNIEKLPQYLSCCTVDMMGHTDGTESALRLCICQTRWDENNAIRPSPHLPAGDRSFYMEKGLRLYNAALFGDMEEMQRILGGNENGGINLLCCSLTERYETALHVAVGAKQTAIVKELVEKMQPQDLDLRDEIGNTAFCMAAMTRSREIANILIKKNPNVAFVRGAENMTPLHIAAIWGNPEMIRFLYQKFEVEQHIDHLYDEDEERDIFFACIYNNLFDIAIKIFNGSRRRSNLPWEKDEDGKTALEILAKKPSEFGGKSSTMPKRIIECFCCWKNNTISMQKKALELTKLLCMTMQLHPEKSFKEKMDCANELLYEAAQMGNHKFLFELSRLYPGLIFKKDKDRGSIFHIAALNRYATIFKHIHSFGLKKDIILLYEYTYLDGHDNERRYNMLQLVAKLPSLERLNSVPGPALQMRQELLWFKEVEDLTPKLEREKRDEIDKLTPRELFTKEHKELRKDGEKWMKSTATSCMIVVTLIAGAIFQTASSLGGGLFDVDDKNYGNRTLTSHVLDVQIETWFRVFIVFNVIAICSSIISILMFLSILVSRYAEEDFLFRLPLKLGVGLAALLLSLLASMVSFGANFFLAYSKYNLIWVVLLVSVTSFLAVDLFVMLQWGLLRDVFRSKMIKI